MVITEVLIKKVMAFLEDVKANELKFTDVANMHGVPNRGYMKRALKEEGIIFYPKNTVKYRWILEGEIEPIVARRVLERTTAIASEYWDKKSSKMSIKPEEVKVAGYQEKVIMFKPELLKGKIGVRIKGDFTLEGVKLDDYVL